MKAVTKLLAGCAAGAALFAAAPAAAQYPGYGYPGYGSGGVIGQVINSVIGGGYGAYGANQHQAVGQCVGAVQQRLNSNYGAGYGYNNGYYSGGAYGGGYAGAYGGGRVLGISRVEQRSGGGLTVRGVANSGRNAGYAQGYAQPYGQGYGYGQGYAPAYAQPPVDLTFKCKTDYRGFVVDVDIDPAQSNYGQVYGRNYTPYSQDYSQYGYRRY